MTLITEICKRSERNYGSNATMVLFLIRFPRLNMETKPRSFYSQKSKQDRSPLVKSCQRCRHLSYLFVDWRNIRMCSPPINYLLALRLHTQRLDKVHCIGLGGQLVILICNCARGSTFIDSALRTMDSSTALFEGKYVKIMSSLCSIFHDRPKDLYSMYFLSLYTLCVPLSIVFSLRIQNLSIAIFPCAYPAPSVAVECSELLSLGLLCFYEHFRFWRWFCKLKDWEFP